MHFRKDFCGCFETRLRFCKNLLEKKGKSINVNAIDSRSGYTPLIQALVNKDEEMVKYLLSLDRIDVNAVDNKNIICHHYRMLCKCKMEETQRILQSY